MVVAPHSSDVAPFTALNTSTSGLLDDTVQMAVFRYKVLRSFWSAHLNTILPIFAVAFLCQLVFWIPEDDLVTRIGLCISLFLTLIGELRFVQLSMFATIAVARSLIPISTWLDERTWPQQFDAAGM